jgi:hypothetical protein
LVFICLKRVKWEIFGLGYEVEELIPWWFGIFRIVEYFTAFCCECGDVVEECHAKS